MPVHVTVNRWLTHPASKPLWFLCSLLPLLWLVSAAWLDALGANPAEALIRATGDWTLRALCVVLLITPVRVVSSIPALARFRRMAGLFVFFYALMHLLSYTWFDMGFEWSEVAVDILKRPFILVGFVAFLLLSTLALTSFKQAVLWLGANRWKTLHKAVYAIAMLAVLHFFWMRAGKNDFAEVGLYAALLGALLGWRLWRAMATAKRPG